MFFSTSFYLWRSDWGLYICFCCLDTACLLKRSPGCFSQTFSLWENIKTSTYLISTLKVLWIQETTFHVDGSHRLLNKVSVCCWCLSGLSDQYISLSLSHSPCPSCFSLHRPLLLSSAFSFPSSLFLSFFLSASLARIISWLVIHQHELRSSRSQRINMHLLRSSFNLCVCVCVCVCVF